MDTAAPSRCQLAGPGKFARWIVTVAGWLCLGLDGQATPPSPTWQAELDALRASEAAIAVLPPERAPEATRRLDELFDQLSARYPREVTVRKAAGEHFWRKNNAAAAIAEWMAAQALDPGDADTASALGSAWLREGQARRACEQFQRAVATGPSTARHHFDLGNVLFLFRRELVGLPTVPDEAAALRESLAELRRARDLAPGNAEYAQAYAETFYGVPSPEWREALDAWERFRALPDASADLALSHLARISLRLGQPDEADRYLEKIQDPRFDALRTKMRRQAAALRQDARPEGTE